MSQQQLLRLTTLALLGAAAGCYTFEPVPLSELQPQMGVRARLSVEQSEAFQDALPNQDRLLEGTVVENGSDHLMLQVPVSTLVAPGRFETIGQRLEIPNSGILEVERKELDRTRTYIAVGVGGVVVGAILYQIFEGKFGGDTQNRPPGPVETTFPIRIPIGNW